MKKRKIIIGTYDTAAEGQWVLSSLSLGRAEYQENYLSVPGHSGLLDLSTVLTDGEPYYGSREFEAILESSEGTRQEREERINRMVNQLDGWRHNIVLPDDPEHYISGRLKVERLFNNLVNASVRVAATCDPWKYNNAETVVALVATDTEQTASLINSGRRSVVPTIIVKGGDVTIKYNTAAGARTQTLSPGEYIEPNLYLKTGSVLLRYQGTGQIIFTYREAVL